MILLFDIGNTHTHVGWARGGGVGRQFSVPTRGWVRRGNRKLVREWVGSIMPKGVAICSVVPGVTPEVVAFVRRQWGVVAVELNAGTVEGVGVDYPRPETIGPDRLANAIAVRHHYGCPAVAVDFGTAVTVDVVNSAGDYVGGVIAPGLAAMTDYLHEKTALLPRIRIREVSTSIGRSTEEAMLIGAVHGYRGLISEVIGEVKRELGVRRLPVVATGGYAGLIARGLRQIQAVDPTLTLEGLRLFWELKAGVGVG
ncbi:MAG: hypothetical protein RI897_94 [Verrucomicrobiota bacterium]